MGGNAREGVEAKGLTIGQLSERTGCPVETIRYYERAGVLRAPPRTGSGRRTYGDAHVRQLMFVRRARELGFSLDRTRALLQLSERGEDPSLEARAIAAAHLEETQHRLGELERIARALRQLLDECQRPDRIEPCPVLAALTEGGRRLA